MRRKLIYVDLDEIAPAEANPKQHHPETIEASISRFGYVEPLIVDERTGRLVAGHGRRDQLVAMRDRGDPAPPGIQITKGHWTAPVVTGWSSEDDDEALALGIALNRTSELGGWNTRELAPILDGLEARGAGFLDGLGYARPDIDQMLADLRREDRANAPRSDPDDAPAVPKEPVSKRGDLWLLGEHRLLCGDSSDPAQVERLLGSERAEMVLADPPYNVGWAGEGSRLPREDAYFDDRPDYGLWLAQILKIGADFSDSTAALHLWFGPPETATVLSALQQGGWVPRAYIVWNKETPGVAHASMQYKPCFEPLLYAHKKGKTPRWFGPSDERSVWDVSRPVVSESHPTLKPVALYERSLRNHSRPGAIVLELFGGSGTSLIACEMGGRVGRVMEELPEFCDVAAARFQAFTGEKPILESTGEPHDFSETP